MNTLKTSVKELLGEALVRTGVWERALRKWARRGEAIILTYHRVIEKWDRTLDYSHPGLVVTSGTFHRQLAFLKKHFNIVPLSYFINRTSNTQHPKPLCAITFDDGWRDNYEIAFPILRKHDVPATIFLTTDFIGTDRAFWHTQLMYLLMHGDLSRLRLLGYVFQACPAPVRHGLMRLAQMGQAPGAHDVDPLIEAVKTTCDETTTDQFIHDVGNALGLRRHLFPDRRFFLDWDQVREMAEAGIEIGSHGCSHRILIHLKTEDAEEELVRSKGKIERSIGQEVQHFAFPNGDANQNLMVLTGKAGYRTASLCVSGPDGGRLGPLTLRRLGMAEAVSIPSDGSFSETSLLLWVFRAPRMRLT